ncbi:MAG: aminomethyl-transferring glycine dehydrogenase subunit GcvPB [Actinobacteria bacterium]|nr:aminomethyl-transferring glycine dehydrogenase subunit GcvPB [Actinomycetota bacterium]
MAKLEGVPLSSPGRRGYSLPSLDVPAVDPASVLPPELLRTRPARLPELSEVDVVRHFTALSRRNHGVDNGFYPLGSCTMKYNPKVNEYLAGLPGLALLHPYQPEESVQGALELMFRTERFLAEITGMDRVTLQPAAGAHGEFTGMAIIRAYHANRGRQRHKVLIPDSAHGTNPATAAMCGYQVVQVPSDERGGVDLQALRELADHDVAALMLTNPNTLGLFDENIGEIAQIVHDAGGLLYYDGANANAILGYCRPGDMGFDVMHLNLHKTFSTPHGGGGPGSGPVGVKAELEPFLPVPTVESDGERYRLDYDRPLSIGKVRSFYGNFGVIVKAYAYIMSMGPEGLRRVSENAVINANYLLAKLKADYDLPYDRFCKHEFVLSGRRQKAGHGVRTLDIAKRILDFGYHPPTVYFPLIVEEAIMIEPTETESRETLDAFAAAMAQIAREAEGEPEKVKGAPYDTPVGRLDEALAARKPDLRFRFADEVS